MKILNSFFFVLFLYSFIGGCSDLDKEQKKENNSVNNKNMGINKRHKEIQNKWDSSAFIYNSFSKFCKHIQDFRGYTICRISPDSFPKLDIKELYMVHDLRSLFFLIIKSGDVFRIPLVYRKSVSFTCSGYSESLEDVFLYRSCLFNEKFYLLKDEYMEFNYSSLDSTTKNKEKYVATHTLKNRSGPVGIYKFYINLEKGQMSIQKIKGKDYKTWFFK